MVLIMVCASPEIVITPPSHQGSILCDQMDYVMFKLLYILQIFSNLFTPRLTHVVRGDRVAPGIASGGVVTDLETKSISFIFL